MEPRDSEICASYVRSQLKSGGVFVDASHLSLSNILYMMSLKRFTSFFFFVSDAHSAPWHFTGRRSECGRPFVMLIVHGQVTVLELHEWNSITDVLKNVVEHLEQTCFCTKCVDRGFSRCLRYVKRGIDAGVKLKVDNPNCSCRSIPFERKKRCSVNGRECVN